MNKKYGKTFLTLTFAFLCMFILSYTAFGASEAMAQGGFKHALASLMDNSLIAAALLTLGLAGILIELFVTGFGIAGFVGIVSFLLYFLGNIWAGHVTAAVFILFVVGLLMLIAEIFVTPGMGALGIL